MGNSVIYRPAYDAEVEYLESTGTQWIDTGVYGNDDTAIECKVYITNTSKRFNIVGARDGFTNTISIMYIPYLIISDFKNVTEQDGRLSVNKSSINNFIAYTSKSLRKIIDEYSENEWTLTQGMSGVSPSQSIKIGYKDVGYPDGYGNAYIKLYYCKIWNGSTLIRDFIPVRIGSVGYMYDKVSKQLFANKGTGNFILGNDVVNAVIPQQRCVLYFGNQRSVGFERIYEEYEWLYTELPEANRFMFLPIGSDTFSFNRVFYKTNSIGFFRTNGYRYYSSQQRIRLWDTNSRRMLFSSSPYQYGELIQVISNSNSDSVTIKDSSIPKYAYDDLDSIAVDFKEDHTDGNFASKFKTSKITVDGVDRYIPVKLLQSIPAILDGNGIARQAGECGMWDKVSNKFYGNVASSGTFTVKGPKCYEEYDWLEVEVSSSENITMMQLPVNSYEFSFIRKWDRYNIVPHSTYFISTLNNANYSYFTNTNYSALIWDGRSTVYTSIKKYSYGGSVSINCDSQNYYIDGESVPIYGECSVIRIDSVIDNPSMVSNVAFSTSAITVDGSVRYVPCKLTHGIPASMDANGIARPSGTCGMWDKVNDVFYGNVASSGSFTVSND